nr:putative protein TPRXL [Coffea arabica]
MTGYSDVTSTASQSPARRRATRIFISSSSSSSSSPSPSPPPPSSSSASNPNLLDPINIMSSSSDRSPSAHSPSARELEEAIELDAYLERRAGSAPSPKSPHDSPGGPQGGAGEDRDSSEGTPGPKQGDDPEFSYGYPDHEEVTISPEAVAELVRSYSIPSAFEPRAAGPDDRASRPPPVS